MYVEWEATKMWWTRIVKHGGDDGCSGGGNYATKGGSIYLNEMRRANLNSHLEDHNRYSCSHQCLTDHFPMLRLSQPHYHRHNHYCSLLILASHFSLLLLLLFSPTVYLAYSVGHYLCLVLFLYRFDSMCNAMQCAAPFPIFPYRVRHFRRW